MIHKYRVTTKILDPETGGVVLLSRERTLTRGEMANDFYYALELFDETGASYLNIRSEKSIDNIDICVETEIVKEESA